MDLSFRASPQIKPQQKLPKAAGNETNPFILPLIVQFPPSQFATQAKQQKEDPGSQGAALSPETEGRQCHRYMALKTGLPWGLCPVSGL